MSSLEKEELPCKTCLTQPICRSKYKEYNNRETKFNKTMFEGCSMLLGYILTDSIRERLLREEEFKNFFDTCNMDVTFLQAIVSGYDDFRGWIEDE